MIPNATALPTPDSAGRWRPPAVRSGRLAVAALAEAPAPLAGSGEVVRPYSATPGEAPYCVPSRGLR